MSKSYLLDCPRCGSRSYEQLPTNSHCAECLYSADLVFRKEKRRFLTLREAEGLMGPVSVHEIKMLQKKVSGVVS